MKGTYRSGNKRDAQLDRAVRKTEVSRKLQPPPGPDCTQLVNGGDVGLAVILTSFEPDTHRGLCNSLTVIATLYGHVVLPRADKLQNLFVSHGQCNRHGI